MKCRGQDETQRWRDRTPDGTTAEDRAAAIIAGALSPSEPDARRLARVERRLFSPRRERRPSRVVFRAAIVAVVMVAGAATVKAYEMARRSGWFGMASATASKTPAQAPARQVAKARRAENPGTPPGSREPTSAPVVPTAEGRPTPSLAVPPPERTSSVVALPSGKVPSLPEPRRPTPGSARTATPGATVSPMAPQSSATRRSDSRDIQLAYSGRRPEGESAAPPEPSPLQPSPSVTKALPVTPSPLSPLPAPQAALPPPASPAPPAPQATLPPPASTAPPVAQAPSASDEVRALDQAMTLLRREHDGARALAALDAYLARFPRGLLNREARFARVDALLLLGRPDQALAALEVLPLDRGRRSTELQVIRAELRARNSCTSAAADFDAALSQSPNAALLERIFYGRGVCRSKLGDLAGAADDLHRYVERFPNGVHARSAREWIESTESRPSHKGAP